MCLTAGGRSPSSVGMFSDIPWDTMMPAGAAARCCDWAESAMLGVLLCDCGILCDLSHASAVAQDYIEMYCQQMRE